MSSTDAPFQPEEPKASKPASRLFLLQYLSEPNRLLVAHKLYLAGEKGIVLQDAPGTKTARKKKLLTNLVKYGLAEKRSPRGKRFFATERCKLLMAQFLQNKRVQEILAQAANADKTQDEPDRELQRIRILRTLLVAPGGLMIGELTRGHCFREFGYKILRELEDLGWIQKEQIIGKRNKPAFRYSLTEIGRLEARRLCAYRAKPHTHELATSSA